MASTGSTVPSDKSLQLQIHADFSDPDRPPCVTCLRAVGQTRPVGIPFNTDSGKYLSPPFHIHCRCIVMPYVPGFEEKVRNLARRLLLSLPLSKLRPPPPLASAID